MKKIALKSVLTYIALLPILFFLSSCSGEDYLNAIPENSIALVSVDAQQLLDNNNADAVKGFLGIDDKCGIDLSEKLYIFETAAGNIGMSAKIADDKQLEDWIKRLSEKGYCNSVSEYRDYRFTVIKDAFVAGFSSDAMVIMGPSLPSQHNAARQEIVKLLGQKGDKGIKGTPIFNKIDSLDSPVAFVAQAAALPENIAAPFTIGAPKDADASQVMIAAELDINESGLLTVRGETFSFNKDIDKELKASSEIFRPITEKYIKNVPAEAALAAFMNVNGEQFIKLLHQNKTFQALLTGMNTAVDMDNIIKSIDGDVVIASQPDTSKSAGRTNLQMCATLKNKAFLDDVDYWKQSCPAGSKITDWGNNSYCYTGNGITYYFGVSDDMQFYSGSTETYASQILHNAQNTLPSDIQNSIKGQRLAVMLNIGALIGQGDSSGIVKSLLGNNKIVLYIMK